MPFKRTDFGFCVLADINCALLHGSARVALRTSVGAIEAISDLEE
jgi:hypothetical protein